MVLFCILGIILCKTDQLAQCVETSVDFLCSLGIAHIDGVLIIVQDILCLLQGLLIEMLREKAEYCFVRAEPSPLYELWLRPKANLNALNTLIRWSK